MNYERPYNRFSYIPDDAYYTKFSHGVLEIYPKSDLDNLNSVDCFICNFYNIKTKFCSFKNKVLDKIIINCKSYKNKNNVIEEKNNMECKDFKPKSNNEIMVIKQNDNDNQVIPFNNQSIIKIKKIGFIQKLFMTPDQRKELKFQSILDKEVKNLEDAINKLDLNVDQLKDTLEKTYSIKGNIEVRIIKYNEIINRYNLEAEKFVKSGNDNSARRILKKQFIIETQINKYQDILKSYDDYIVKIEDQKDDLELKIMEAKSNNELALLRKDIAMIKLNTSRTLESLNNNINGSTINEMIRDIEYKAIGEDEVEKLLDNDVKIDDVKLDSNIEDRLNKMKMSYKK